MPVVVLEGERDIVFVLLPVELREPAALVVGVRLPVAVRVRVAEEVEEVVVVTEGFTLALRVEVAAAVRVNVALEDALFVFVEMPVRVLVVDLVRVLDDVDVADEVTLHTINSARMFQHICR